ncbi:MAG: transposase [Verrucomicrobia bacterium]|nr:transposase [Verrucomicrobiota bacterium]
MKVNSLLKNPTGKAPRFGSYFRIFERREANQPKQGQFWVDTRHLPRATPNVFYRKLDEALLSMGFAESIRDICRPSYADDEKGGRPGIDPAVYFKMLVIGFFENLPSERAIANRCADSLSLRAFLGYGLDEDTPDHSSLSVIRNRLELDQFRRCHEVVLTGLRKAGLLKGRHLGIDSSVMEANASLRELHNRNTGEECHEYVKNLAAEAGIDPKDAKGVRRCTIKDCGWSSAIPMPTNAMPRSRVREFVRLLPRRSGP